MTFRSSVRPLQPAAEKRATILVGDGVVVAADGAVVRLPTADEVAGLGGERLHLGRHGDVDVDAAALGDSALPAGLERRPLRGLWGSLGEDGFGVAARAVQIIAWDADHRFCGRCARPTERAVDERVRRCPTCALSCYPRVHPAVIVLVHRGDEALLARAANFPMPMFSTLAGFVEPGETLEDCVHREIREEVGIEVDGLRYFGSQPWPFPHSLMIGFHAAWSSGEIQVDGREIAEAGWFRPDALPRIPPRQSIARALIDAWAGGLGPDR